MYPETPIWPKTYLPCSLRCRCLPTYPAAGSFINSSCARRLLYSFPISIFRKECLLQTPLQAWVDHVCHPRACIRTSQLVVMEPSLVRSRSVTRRPKGAMKESDRNLTLRIHLVLALWSYVGQHRLLRPSWRSLVAGGAEKCTSCQLDVGRDRMACWSSSHLLVCENGSHESAIMRNRQLSLLDPDIGRRLVAW